MKYHIVLVPLVWCRNALRVIEDQIWLRIKTLVLSKLWRLECDNTVKFIGPTIIRAYEKGAISIGPRSKFVAGIKNNLVGLTNPTILCAPRGAKIQIGHDVGCSSVVIHAKTSIVLGNYLNIGGNVRIFDHDFHAVEWNNRRPPQNSSAVRSKPIIIEDDVFIGTNAIILKGTHIGARSVIAAGSVVFGLHIPPDSLVKGNPAHVVERKEI